MSKAVPKEPFTEFNRDAQFQFDLHAGFTIPRTYHPQFGGICCISQDGVNIADPLGHLLIGERIL